MSVPRRAQAVAIRLPFTNRRVLRWSAVSQARAETSYAERLIFSLTGFTCSLSLGPFPCQAAVHVEPSQYVPRYVRSCSRASCRDALGGIQNLQFVSHKGVHLANRAEFLREETTPLSAHSETRQSPPPPREAHRPPESSLDGGTGPRQRSNQPAELRIKATAAEGVLPDRRYAIHLDAMAQSIVCHEDS